MRVDVLTLFPEAFAGPLDVSIIKRAREDGLLTLHLTNVRDFATDKHRSVDDYPFGGGQGMVLRVDVLDRCLEHVRAEASPAGLVVYLTPQGERLDDGLVRELALEERLILVCGRYEGVDERFVEHCVDREVSIGDFILTGGELPAMVLIDAVARHIPGALGDEVSPEEESFAEGLLEHPQYTRPAEYRGWGVPAILLGGHHAKIEAWKREQRMERTRERRPDLLQPPSLEEPAKAEAAYAGGRPSLGRAFTAYRRRWALGCRDSETAIGLVFHAWYAMHPPEGRSGLPSDARTLTGREIVAVLKAGRWARSKDERLLFVAGQLALASSQPPEGFDLEGWKERGQELLTAAGALRPDGFSADDLAGCGLAGRFVAGLMDERER